MATGNLGDVEFVDPRCLTLHEMFRVIGDQLTIRDVQMLKFLYGGIMSDDMWHKIDSGFSFLVALEKMKRVDETNFKHLLHLLRIISRHDVSRCVTLRKRKTVERDPVDEYLESTARFTTKRRRGKATYSIISDPNPAPPASSSPPPPTPPSPPQGPPPPLSPAPTPSSSRDSLPSTSAACPAASGSSPSTSHADSPPQGADSTPQGVAPTPTARRRKNRGFTGRRRRARRKVEGRRSEEDEAAGMVAGERSTTASGETIRKKVTCDIRLRVRAEYVQHVSALEGNVFSHKAELVERQFEKFSQANTILKSRDLGSIICDIKFSELTYLDAFWRDYINGSLLEALKGVFITESLKQAVGHEAIKLLVNVDEDDYEAGRLKLLENLKD